MAKSSNATPKNRGPRKYKPEYCEMLIKHMEEGLGFESFGGIVNVDRVTLYRWKESHKEFAEAYNDGWTRCFLFWERVGRSGALGKIKGFNVVAWIFNMKNRFGWRDKNDITIGSGESPIKIVIDKDDNDL